MTIMWNYYGLSGAEWVALTPSQRMAHYKRHAPCKCEIREDLWPVQLYESYSFDPYFHTCHGGTHDALLCKQRKCGCVTCIAGVGHLDGACRPDIATASELK